MIQITNSIIDPNDLVQNQALHPLERTIIEIMSRSRKVYLFHSFHDLFFELRLRTNIVDAARSLYSSEVSFASFSNSRCNPAYWNLTQNGGFKLKQDIAPSVAIRNIYMNGSLYAFECSAAIVIVYYKAVLESIDETVFNRLFANIYLWSWNYDKDLHLMTIKPVDYFPGDVCYFDNPEFHPSAPEWQGENVVFLGDGAYYGHGIGIADAQTMMDKLNEQRKPGATRSAYFRDQATRPDFTYLSRFAEEQRLHLVQPSLANHLLFSDISIIRAKIGAALYLRS